MDRRRLLRTGVVALGVIGLLSSAGWALAAQELGGKVRTGEIVVTEDERVEHDLYASGGSVTINGTVAGDLVVAGGQISITGRVTGDVLAAGGSISLPGEVDGDVRAAGGQLTATGAVGEDVLFAGGQGRIDGPVGGDLLFSAGQLTLDGQVEGDVLGGAGSYTSPGTVAGSEQVTVGEQEAAPTAGDRVLSAVRRFVALLLVAALLLWLASASFLRSGDELVDRPLWSFGGGMLTLIGAAVGVLTVVIASLGVAVLLGLAGLGSLVAAVAAFTVLVVAALAAAVVVAATLVADTVIGLGLVRAVGREQAGWLGNLAAVAAGLVPVVVLTSLPVVGGWIRALVVVFGLGAMLLASGVVDRRLTGSGQAPEAA